MKHCEKGYPLPCRYCRYWGRKSETCLYDQVQAQREVNGALGVRVSSGSRGRDPYLNY